jgi:Disaggregatase related
VEFFPEEQMELTNWSNYAHCTCYFGAGSSLRSYTPIWLISYDKGVSNNQGTLILNNLFYQTGQSYNIPYTGGIVNDGFKDTSIHNNVFDGVKNNAIRNQEGDQGTEIKDNIFTNTHIHNGISQAGTGYSIADLVSTDISITNNCFYNK